MERNGLAGLTYGRPTSTNLALPLSEWTPVTTNVLSADGNFTITATLRCHSQCPAMLSH